MMYRRIFLPILTCLLLSGCLLFQQDEEISSAKENCFFDPFPESGVLSAHSTKQVRYMFWGLKELASLFFTKLGEGILPRKNEIKYFSLTSDGRIISIFMVQRIPGKGLLVNAHGFFYTEIEDPLVFSYASGFKGSLYYEFGSRSSNTFELQFQFSYDASRHLTGYVSYLQARHDVNSIGSPPKRALLELQALTEIPNEFREYILVR